ncbi:UDP-N-acetylglucosamine diphosphorylase/glucosamine-1-phosphate N-acetyltransferase, partial [Dehalococcoidia bacterium]|nr:UDP-N-acetylglucosamine diphosphorylase/glucosamine-1-phosphate N-acetyltransferase [Dehalococcoidia bacterium]
GKASNIGPNSRLVDASVGQNCNIFESVVEGSTIGNDVNIGPFSHVRYGSYIESGVKIGNFAEIKNTQIGKNTLVGHFSYLGDCFIGDKVNIGAGTITCNFDGEQKHQTIIEKGAFIGSDTKLIAPVRVGTNAVTGAGSVVTKDVKPGSTVVGIPARPINKRTSLSPEDKKERY